ncbi:t-SNARE [Fimicolochytrium jonesii]|uniref:t-SNARE n=1 Tax=Fimicolochytrium jonesii TaxID=1396493 RepID=UPI0022FEA83D|nr:t-SNARE [Fimicolochytrium jonesii]KAI8819440.1 t-SNARE [Fimicolochytrium jonesii]
MSFGDLEKGLPRGGNGNSGQNTPWDGRAGSASSGRGGSFGGRQDTNTHNNHDTPPPFAGPSSTSSTSSPPAGHPPNANDATTIDRASRTIFTISNNVATIQKLVSLFGTEKDTADLRSRLHDTTEETRAMVRQTGSDLKAILAANPSHAGGDTYTHRQRKMAQQKLQKDFEQVLKRFQLVSKQAAEKSREYVSLAKAAHTHAADGFPPDVDVEDADEGQPLMAAHQRQQLVVLDNEIEFNEALIAEREQDLKGIEQSIAEVNEIFRDLGTMVHEQQYMLDNIESNVQAVEINLENATGELRTADRYQRSARNKLCCIMVVVAIVVLVVVLILIS